MKRSGAPKKKSGESRGRKDRSIPAKRTGTGRKFSEGRKEGRPHFTDDRPRRRDDSSTPGESGFRKSRNSEGEGSFREPRERGGFERKGRDSRSERESGVRKPFERKSDDRKSGERKSTGPASERRSSGDKRSSGGASSFDKKPYASRNEGGERPRRFSKPDRGQKGPAKKTGFFRKSDSFNDSFESQEASAPRERRMRPRSRKPAATESADGLTRLNKYIANSGICSRREADQLISTGAIAVNGKVVTELGYKIKPGDTVQYGGETIRPEKNVYILLNKPKDYITTVDDPDKRKTVLDLIAGACKERVYPVGRLDRSTTGVLLLTNDGDLTKKLTHPKYERKKVYHVTLDKNFKSADMDKLREGIMLEDGEIKVDEISYVEAAESKKEVGVELHSGKNRIVRRMFEALGYKVVKLDRVYFAGLTKKDLPRGKWRFLTQREVNMLHMGAE